MIYIELYIYIIFEIGQNIDHDLGTSWRRRTDSNFQQNWTIKSNFDKGLLGKKQKTKKTSKRNAFKHGGWTGITARRLVTVVSPSTIIRRLNARAWEGYLLYCMISSHVCWAQLELQVGRRKVVLLRGRGHGVCLAAAGNTI